ncbi:acyltransferase family protein [Georgenia sp. AZ-5]|uniref:acyltransferase family protein n=1 Tax=Georgenia sp. AZ-5 TaxID=3367526 RepID=UPI003754CF8C
MGTQVAEARPASARQPGRGRTAGLLADAGRIEGLDGLRALAVAAVLVYHLRPASLPGGFLGVDVFFVVSGFLITTLLLREIATRGRIDLARFWLRRARRLLPPLLAVVVLSVPLAWLASTDLLVGIGRQVLGAVTFSSNWLEIGAGSSYFDATAPQLFVNFWSLAVEEQFYLLWPAAVAALVAAAGGRRRTRVALVLAAVSAAFMAVLHTPGEDATRVYYGTDTHLFGLMIGAALAFAFATPGTALRPRRGDGAGATSGPRWPWRASPR